MSISPIGGQHYVPVPANIAKTAGAEKGESGPDTDGDADNSGAKVGATSSSVASSGAGSSVNILA
jgi:hypothetical protein